MCLLKDNQDSTKKKAFTNINKLFCGKEMQRYPFLNNIII